MHDLLHEFAGHWEKILALQKQSNRFKKMAEEDQEADNYIHRIEEGIEPTAYENLNELSMKRAHLKTIFTSCWKSK